MTVVFSGGSDSYLVMANDCAIVNDFPDGRVEYATGGKFFLRNGVGVVTMWGARDGNRLISHLNAQELSGDKHSVEDLAQIVHHYLTDSYRPHIDSTADTGYHVGGFTPDGQLRLYHIYWNVGRSEENQRPHWGSYALEFRQPPPGLTGFMFNGRHDLVSNLMQSLINEVARSKLANFPFTPAGVSRLAHFILRASAEITKEVSPPFLVHILSPSRRCITVRVDAVIPSTDATFAEAIREVGLS